MYDNDGNMTDAAMLQVVSEEKRKCQLLLEGALAENERLKAAMREFCDRVDAGEVRSIRTYTKFKTLLGE